jgi:hypothetical protein
MDYLKDAIGGFTAGLLAVAFFPFSAVLVLMLGHNPALERGIIPGGDAAINQTDNTRCGRPSCLADLSCPDKCA